MLLTKNSDSAPAPTLALFLEGREVITATLLKCVGSETLCYGSGFLVGTKLKIKTKLTTDIKPSMCFTPLIYRIYFIIIFACELDFVSFYAKNKIFYAQSDLCTYSYIPIYVLAFVIFRRSNSSRILSSNRKII